MSIAEKANEYVQKEYKPSDSESKVIMSQVEKEEEKKEEQESTVNQVITVSTEEEY